MNCKVFVLAMAIVIGSSCKHKEETINTPPPQETPPPTTPQPQEPKPHTPDHHGSEHDEHGDCDKHHHEHDDHDDCDKHHHGKKHHRLPPGQEKKLHGDKSAKKYAPGHKK